MAKFDDRIVHFISQSGYKPAKPKSVAKKLGVTKKTVLVFRDALQQLLDTGRARMGSDGRVHAPTRAGAVVGVLKTIRSGDGYVNLHQPMGKHTEVFVAAEDMRDALSGDEVLVVLTERRRGGGTRCGRIVEILKRAATEFVGTYFESKSRGMVKIDGDVFRAAVSVGDPGAKGAHPDDKVVVELVQYPTYSRAAEGVITKVLGPAGEPEVDLLATIHTFGLPHEFPHDVVDEAHIQAEQFDADDLQGREDCTKETIVTIDPADARDFDDAISLKKSADGHWHLGVHIADVAHFIPEGSRLDDEAQHRSTSVYLPLHVIPMIPEVISNGLASLQEKRVRFAKSVRIEFTVDGIPVSTSFHRTAIKVTRRFSYDQVMPIVREPDAFKAKAAAPVRALLSKMHELAMLLRARRVTAGALEMELPEMVLDYDEHSQVVGAHTTEHDDSHKIIEEFMLAANIAVATELTDRRVPFLRRIHADPTPVKLRRFAEFAALFGFEIRKFQSRHALQSLVRQAMGHSAQQAINFALLRSMKQAEYAPSDVGHYGLGVDNYCHFTSPIRRYPDLTVHRLVDRIIDGKKRINRRNESDVARLGRHCSSTERRAERAERDLLRVKLLRFMADRIGDELDATITGVENFGIFCQGIDIPAEGMVHISRLASLDEFTHNPGEYCLTGRSSKRELRLGDRIRVRVASVDVERRKLDFELPEMGDPPSRATSGVSPKRESSKPPRDSASGKQTIQKKRRHKSRKPKSKGR
ncbi:MAG: ribonuclease R [Planctomycetota bacterium]|nr:ribonuclease R [Planctomycetota bacterium]